MIRVIHHKCGKVAFYFKRKLEHGDAIKASNVILVDGTEPNVGDIVQCGSCFENFGGHVSGIHQEHWTDWFIPDEKRKG